MLTCGNPKKEDLMILGPMATLILAIVLAGGLGFIAGYFFRHVTAEE